MTQEQLNQIEAWRDSLDVKQNDENIVNAMWLAEEMWERHHSIMKFKNVYLNFSTYMMAFCMALMEYIWIPHDIIKEITANLDDLDTMPEKFFIHRNWCFIHMSYMGTNDEGHYYEMQRTLQICDTKTKAEALTAILNHANKSGHDAIKRLSA